MGASLGLSVPGPPQSWHGHGLCGPISRLISALSQAPTSRPVTSIIDVVLSGSSRPVLGPNIDACDARVGFGVCRVAHCRFAEPPRGRYECGCTPGTNDAPVKIPGHRCYERDRDGALLLLGDVVVQDHLRSDVTALRTRGARELLLRGVFDRRGVASTHELMPNADAVLSHLNGPLAG